MARIEILLPPAKLDGIRETLADIGVDGMTLSEVKTVEPESRRCSVYRGSTYIVDFTSKVKMELEVRDGTVARVVEFLRGSSSRTRPGSRRTSSRAARTSAACPQTPATTRATARATRAWPPSRPQMAETENHRSAVIQGFNDWAEMRRDSAECEPADVPSLNRSFGVRGRDR